MGVGRGVTLSKSIGSNRRKKMWFSKTFLLEVKKLGNILAAQYAYKGKLAIIENIDNNALKK